MAVQDVELGFLGLPGVRCLDPTLFQFPLLYHEHLPSVIVSFLKEGTMASMASSSHTLSIEEELNELFCTLSLATPTLAFTR